MSETDREREYYQEVEDFFARARGRPHTLSPKDVQLLRSWWSDQIPVEAVTHAIAEVFARRAERGEEDPAVSLSYCRHAVKREAKRLAAVRAGATPEHTPAAARDSAAAVDRLADELAAAASALTSDLAAVAAAVRGAVSSVRALKDDAPNAVDDRLYALEAHLLKACLEALPRATREELEERAGAAAAHSGARGPALERSRRALLDRELRQLLALPRLELG